jgi:hypothetical protein
MKFIHYTLKWTCIFPNRCLHCCVWRVLKRETIGQEPKRWDKNKVPEKRRKKKKAKKPLTLATKEYQVMHVPKQPLLVLPLVQSPGKSQIRWWCWNGINAYETRSETSLKASNITFYKSDAPF